jgi:hypothetical protein
VHTVPIRVVSGFPSGVVRASDVRLVATDAFGKVVDLKIADTPALVLDQVSSDDPHFPWSGQALATAAASQGWAATIK